MPLISLPSIDAPRTCVGLSPCLQWSAYTALPYDYHRLAAGWLGKSTVAGYPWAPSRGSDRADLQIRDPLLNLKADKPCLFLRGWLISGHFSMNELSGFVVPESFYTGRRISVLNPCYTSTKIWDSVEGFTNSISLCF